MSHDALQDIVRGDGSHLLDDYTRLVQELSRHRRRDGGGEVAMPVYKWVTVAYIHSDCGGHSFHPHPAERYVRKAPHTTHGSQVGERPRRLILCLRCCITAGILSSYSWSLSGWPEAWDWDWALVRFGIGVWDRDWAQVRFGTGTGLRGDWGPVT